MAPDGNNTRRALLAASAIAGTLALLGLPAAAQQQAEYEFNIPAQSLGSALRAFGVAADQQIVFTDAELQGRVAPSVRGSYTADEALQTLLAGTGLYVHRRQSGLLQISVSQDPQSGGAAGGGADVEALVVTAQKREEDIQDVPIAISAFTQEDLTRSQVAGGPDLMTQVPNMTFTKTNFSSYSIQIRGVGTQAISATTDPAVAVAFNNTPFIRNRFFEQEFYDLQRVEVLRGPQGTLYGRNATAGVVNIISAKPSFGFDSRLAADVANYNSTRLEGMLNAPLVDDRVALRLAGAWTKREGYSTNEITGNPIDGRDLWSTRLSLRFAPTDNLEANLIWEHFQENDDRLRSGKQLCHKHIVTELDGLPVPYDERFPGGQKTYYQSQLSQGCTPASLYAPESFETPNGYQFGFYVPMSAIGLPIAPGAGDPYVSTVQSRDLRVIESTVDPGYKADSDTVELQVNLALSDTLSLTSETAWASDFIFSTQDYNRFNTSSGAWRDTEAVFGPGRPGVLEDGVFCDPQIGCSDRLVAVDLSTAKSRHFSQELRLGSDFDGPFNFSLGANFLRYDTEDKYYVFINSLNLYSATSFASGILTPYAVGVSDNHECLGAGLEEVTATSDGTLTSGHNCVYMDPNPIGSLNDLGHNYFLSKNPYKLISYAAFGEAYYNFSDNLKLTAGLRWTIDKKEAPRIPSWVLAPGTIGYPVLQVVEQEWREPTGRVALDWKPQLSFTDETLLYASYAHGYKAGGANPPPAGVALNVNTGNGVAAPSTTHPTTFDAEFVNAFELGAKNTFLDGVITVNMAAFYYDYTGYQISQIIDRSAVNLNFDAEAWGLEVEADWRPLENLRLGFKGGYENTRLAEGSKTVDVMDRTAGHDGWIVVKPFPIYPSNCILPSWLWTGTGTIHQVGNPAGSADGPCDMAYFRGVDPITGLPYVPNPTVEDTFAGTLANWPAYPNPGYYPGFDPSTAPNNGEGFDKDVSGNELPNAPNFTATITADYTLPLPSAWLMTLHTDLYYQSEAWWRIFNTEGYDKLKAYTNVNLAAIFTNEDAGWKVMAYVKNVFDRDSITGAFLNSDDTGLTTNVFLTEPRLYGLRVTKEWNGGAWWTGGDPSGPAGEHYPLTIELGGQVQRHDALYDPLRPSFADMLTPALDNINQAQNQKLDWGDGRDIEVTYRPGGGAWKIGIGARYGKTNGSGPRLRAEEETEPSCGMEGTYYETYCDPDYAGGALFDNYTKSETNFTDIAGRSREEFQVVDFSVGRDVGIGGLGRSTISGGLRRTQLESQSAVEIGSVFDWNLPPGWYFAPNYATHSRYVVTLSADREFEGTGPVISWEGSLPLSGDKDVGHLGLDWIVTGGVLFGKRNTDISGTEIVSAYESLGLYVGSDVPTPALSIDSNVSSVNRQDSATVPLLDVSLGLSYDIGRMRIGAGYRWERYFDVLDVGYSAQRAADRTVDGPYFKIAIGFGG